MASQDEVLRLAAEVVDRWSGPLADMRRAMVRMQEETKAGHKRGVDEATKHSVSITKLNQTFAKLDENLKSSFRPALAAVGVTALSVGGAIAVLKDSLAGFGATVQQLRFLSRETGITINQLRGLDALAERIGTTPDTINKSLQAFAKHMHDRRNLVKSELDLWNDVDTPLKRNGFLDRLAHMPNLQGYLEALRELHDIRDPQEKRMFLSKLSIPQEFANLKTSELRQAIEDIRARLRPWTDDDIKKAEEFNRAMFNLSLSWKNLKTEMAITLGPTFTELSTQIEDFLNRNDQQIKHLLGDVRKELKQTTGDLQHFFKLMLDWDTGRLSPESNKFLFGDKGSPTDPLGIGHSFTDEPLFKYGLKGWDWLKRGYNYLAPEQPVSPDKLFHNESFVTPLHSGGGFRLMNASFTSGGSEAEAVIAKSVKAGTLEALREFAYSGLSDNGFGGGAGGITNASLPLSGVGGAARVGALLRAKRYAALPPGGNAGADIVGKAVREGQLAGPVNGPLDRSRFAKELADNPGLKEKIFQLAAGEDRPSHGQSAMAFQSVLESMMNRAEVRGTSLAAQAKWYGREPGGYYAGRPSHLSAHERAVAEHALNDVLSGSNVSNYATDNSSGGLAARERATGRFRFRSQYHGESFFAPGWGEPRFARNYDRWRGRQGEGLLQHYTTDEIQRAIGMQLNHKVEGSASVHVKFDGLPKGARAFASSTGVFGPVTLHRGRTMVPAGQGD